MGEMKTPEELADLLIHDIEVTDENVGDMLHSELFRLIHKYGGAVKDELFAIAIGPNAYKSFMHFERKRASFSFALGKDSPMFHGIRVVCGPLPFFVPLFTDRGWHYAHEEAKRLMQKESDSDIN
jgi:hypothetical protein